MIPANLTCVTFYRARLDPLDLYRLDDILNHDGSPCYDTPAAALATHLREISPEIRWGGDIPSYCAELGLESNSMVILGAKFQARYGPCTVFSNFASVHGSALYARRINFSQGLVLHTPAVLQACSMGSTSQQPDSTGDVSRWEPMSKRSPDTAYELATRAEPLVTPTSISIAASFNSQCSPDVSTDAVEGFVQIPWRLPLWHDPVPPAPGEDAAYDYARNTEEGNPAAIMASIVQGDGYPPQVNLVSPEK